jgi:hypothetical protein
MSRPWKSQRFDPPRPLHVFERAVIAQLLNRPFAGRDEIREQLAHATVVEEGREDTATIVFSVPTRPFPLAGVVSRVPVEGEAIDSDGGTIAMLLHVLESVVVELEIYRADGEHIVERQLTPPARVWTNSDYPGEGDG